ncbi:MAG: acetolactate synthase small subunit [Lachnospiraceae bacterium]|nr:acetolactate synthase small subunit [Lachnospiraceae bacterium]
MKQQILSVLVENNPGVLSHVSGLFSRRGYNIDSISTGPTMDPRFTRLTIVTSGDEQILEQIEKQLMKLEDVKYIKKLKARNSVCRELILVKIRANNVERQQVINVTEIYHGRIVSTTKDAMVVELTGTQDKLDAFLTLLSDYEILELARTGLTGLSRGADDVINL